MPDVIYVMLFFPHNGWTYISFQLFQYFSGRSTAVLITNISKHYSSLSIKILSFYLTLQIKDISEYEGLSGGLRF